MFFYQVSLGPFICKREPDVFLGRGGANGWWTESLPHQIEQKIWLFPCFPYLFSFFFVLSSIVLLVFFFYGCLYYEAIWSSSCLIIIALINIVFNLMEVPFCPFCLKNHHVSVILLVQRIYTCTFWLLMHTHLSRFYTRNQNTCPSSLVRIAYMTILERKVLQFKLFATLPRYKTYGGLIHFPALGNLSSASVVTLLRLRTKNLCPAWMFWWKFVDTSRYHYDSRVDWQAWDCQSWKFYKLRENRYMKALQTYWWCVEVACSQSIWIRKTGVFHLLSFRVFYFLATTCSVSFLYQLIGWSV